MTIQEELCFEIKDRYIKNMFRDPDGFIVCVPVQVLDDIVGHDEVIISNIKCCGLEHDDTFTLFQNGAITVANVIDLLVEIKYFTGCDHCFLETVNKANDNNIVELFFGS